MAMFFAALPLAAALHGPVRVESGRLSGIAGSNAAVTVFKGIPFAAPPVGDLRWRPPQPAAKWKGIRQAGQLANSVRERRPVMVWIHGGGLTRGSGSARNYDGEELARKGVVLVTIEGRPGFLRRRVRQVSGPGAVAGNRRSPAIRQITDGCQ